MFTDERRRVFPYDSGGGPVYGDPVAIQTRLTVALGGRLNRLLADFYFDSKQDGLTEEQREAGRLASCAAAEQIRAAVREAFGLVPFDPLTGAGATAADCDRALAAWLRWVDEAKKVSPP